MRGATLTAGNLSKQSLFQSTHPVRGATCWRLLRQKRRDISIHAPRAGCDAGAYALNILTDISIHAPRAGCDAQFFRVLLSLRKFQSTHPVRGATIGKMLDNYVTLISIHAPRAGCDGKFDGFTRPNLRKRYKKVSVQPKKRAKKKIKEMLCSHSHIFGWISGAKVPEFPAR